MKRVLSAMLVLMTVMLAGCAGTKEVTIPPMFVGETTQEALNALAEEKGYEAITLNEDGSATYKMTAAQHKAMLSEMTKSMDETLAEMPKSEAFPNVVSIEANDDYTDFKIVTTNEELDITERFSVMMFYSYGGMYSAFKGEEVDNIHVSFINEASGEVIEERNSKDMGQ